MAAKQEKIITEECRDCGKQKARFYEIKTQRKQKIIICHDCMKNYQRREAASARDS